MSTWDDLAQVLDEMMADFRVVGSPDVPSEERIEAVEARLAVRFPDEYKDLVRRASAIGVEAKEEVWPPPKPFDVGPSWTFLRGLYVLGIGNEVPDFLDIEKVTTRFREEQSSQLTPFFYLLGSADRYCFTPEGRIVAWRYDAPSAPETCEQGFYDLVLSWANELRTNAERMKSSRT